MTSFMQIANLNNFIIEALDTSEIDKISNWFPKNGIVDLNIAERGMILSLHGQNICQEHVTKLDIWIGYKEAEKNKAWINAILRAKENGFKTVKDKEWYAQADDEFISSSNELVLARAAKKYFENKASNFSSWHYAFKTFLNRDYSIERLGNFQSSGYNYSGEFDQKLHPSDQNSEDEISSDESNDWGDIEEDTIMWK